MKFFSKILLIRPLCFLILLGVAFLLVWKLCGVTNNFEENVNFLSEELQNMSVSEIKHTANLLIPLNSSASNLARTLSSSLNGTELSFDIIQSKVAPSIFLALSTLPYVSHVSYYGLDGLVFSYFNVDDQTFALFSNTSSSPQCYTQPVNRDTGKLYGQAINSDTESVLVNVSSFQESPNRTMAFSSLARERNDEQDLLFLNNVAMDGRGVISVGFPAKIVIDHFASLEFYGGDLHLATCGGEVLVRTKLPDTIIDVNNYTVSVRSMNGDFEEVSGSYLCKLDDGELSHFHVEINGKKHIFYCSTLHIAGIESVFVLAFPSRGSESFVYDDSILALILLALIFAILVISLGAIIVIIIRGARREMCLCAALVKQMESTQQAERKSMNKSLAFASACHDVRASLAAITGLIDLCLQEAKPNSELATNLMQINGCAFDLVGILNSVLDTSKIEAGKMQLEEEEFNLAQLLEDVVEMFYPLGNKKKVDIVLDHYEMMKQSLVRGDRGKLKQILCNLLSNAIKFTSEGHISIRAVVRKPSLENEIIASNRNVSILSCLSRICRGNGGNCSNLDALHAVQQNPNCMEYVIDVDDTGKGIPEDKRKSVFENFVQVKDTALGQGGCGLGLGIVQSLVRLMGGEIKILDKAGGKGTLFQFNIFLTACQPVMSDIENQVPYMHNDSHSTDLHHHHFGFHFRSFAPRPDGSHVFLLVNNEERGRVCKKVFENLDVKVSVFFRSDQCLLNAAAKLKRWMDCKESLSNYGDSTSNEGPSNPKDEYDSNLNVSHYHRKSSSKSSSGLILVVVDSNAEESFEQLCSDIAYFKIKNEIHSADWKFVLLADPTTRNKEDEKRANPIFDEVIPKPFHGSRLYRVIRLLPEFGGVLHSKGKTKTTEEVVDSSSKDVINKDNFIPSKGRDVVVQQDEPEEVVIYEDDSGQGLNGKNVLLVEDNVALRKLLTRRFEKLGAKVDTCENGKEAFELVSKILKEKNEGQSEISVFDFIFMDCQMPVMDGYEATGLIRKEERVYGIHIPIIALTACSSSEEAAKSIEAGMDFHLTKPFEDDKLLKYIRSVSMAQK